MNFRQAYAQDIVMRSVDFSCHVIISTLLVMIILRRFSWLGFSLQWIPDIVLPIIFTRSMITGRFVPETDAVLFMHKKMHDKNVLLWISIAFGLMLLNSKWALLVLLQLMTHYLIDSFTHTEEWK